MLELIFTLVVFGGWVISVCLHEFGHALVAYWGGDISVKEKGYLTLNPLKYTNPTLSVIMPLIFLLLGGIPLPGAAVYINKNLLRNRYWESAVAAAGPGATLGVAIALAHIIKRLGFSAQTAASSPIAADFILDWGSHWFPHALAFLLTLQVAALGLNLMPIPGLDGYGIIEPWLPAQIQMGMKKIKQYGFMALFAAFWLWPDFSNRFWDGVATGVALLGISPTASMLGYSLFQKGSQIVLIGLIVVLVGINQARKRFRPAAAQSKTTEAQSPQKLL